MTSLPVPTTSRAPTIPTGWSLSLVWRFWRLAPWQFLFFAASGVTERLLRMASLLIPIKVVFLLSLSDGSTELPYVGSIRDMGQLGLTLAVLPLGLLPLIAFGVGRLVQDRRTRLGEHLRDAAPIERKQQNLLKTLTNTMSNVFGDALLSVTCVAIMCALLPRPGLVILALTIATGLAIRYRVKRLHARNRPSGAPDDGTNDDAEELEEPAPAWRSADAPQAGQPFNLQQDVMRIARSTQAVGQAIVLPVMVYMVAGALLDNRTDPTSAVAFLFLFRLLSGGVQSVFANGARSMQIFYENAGLRQWVLFPKAGADR